MNNDAIWKNACVLDKIALGVLLRLAVQPMICAHAKAEQKSFGLRLTSAT